MIFRNLILPFSVIVKLPSNGAMIAGFLGFLISNNCFTLSIPCARSASFPATHHPWKVFSVSWVAGSPIDCAAIIPIGIPISTIDLVERSYP